MSKHRETILLFSNQELEREKTLFENIVSGNDETYKVHMKLEGIFMQKLFVEAIWS